MSEEDKFYKFKDLKERARTNAFAHREAMNNSRRKESLWYVITIATSLLSILFITLSYINKAMEEVSFICLILSIILAFVSLFATIFSNHMRYGIISEQHKFLQHSHISIAQRARSVKNLELNEEELTSLYVELQRAFEDIKVRGIEPQDKHFRKAHKIDKGRKEDISPSNKNNHFETKRKTQGIIKSLVSKILKLDNKFTSKEKQESSEVSSEVQSCGDVVSTLTPSA